MCLKKSRKCLCFLASLFVSKASSSLRSDPVDTVKADSEVKDITLPASLKRNDSLKRCSPMQEEQLCSRQLQLDAQKHLHRNNLLTYFEPLSPCHAKAGPLPHRERQARGVEAEALELDAVTHQLQTHSVRSAGFSFLFRHLETGQTRMLIQAKINVVDQSFPEGLFSIDQHHGADSGVNGREEECERDDVLVVHSHLVVHVQVNHKKERKDGHERQGHLDHPHLRAQLWGVGSIGAGFHVTEMDGQVDGDGDAAFRHEQPWEYISE
ncbi:hypothetical protein INR49_025615 [Caranx melampygus]|nr:hypothetical protein INR49_025615 [Caranx melampygus]